ncbi:MAG TPA: hypothetical protein VKV20_13550 [Ktedonobacteraceae bacterium]|jgi:hypothetical protein|nr:hypothetical protein [Ktedonobacteraceae bacterium]
MQELISLRAGVHIEEYTTLTFVRSMLSQAGHLCLPGSSGLDSLAVYLQIVLDQLQQAPSSPYDLLILGGVHVEALTEIPVLLTLERLFALKPLPIMLITNASSEQLRTWQTFPEVVILPEGHLTMQNFFQALGHLTGTFSGIPNPTYGYLNPDVPGLDDQLVEGERSRIKVRHAWLEQRQEWLEQRKTWLEQRQAWLEAREKEQDAQHEWFLEQRAWLEQQRREVEDQEKRVHDLRMWLNLYQQKIDEEQPHRECSA